MEIFIALLVISFLVCLYRKGRADGEVEAGKEHCKELDKLIQASDKRQEAIDQLKIDIDQYTSLSSK